MPYTPGWDVSGVVEAAGAGAARFKKGDEVFSFPDHPHDGAYAEYMVVKEAELAPKPKTLDHVHAAAVPAASLTAWQGLFDVGGLRAGQKALIHGAAGGVGGFAVQFAKWKGAHVIGTASARNQDFLRQLGADEAIDYERTRDSRRSSGTWTWCSTRSEGTPRRGHGRRSRRAAFWFRPSARLRRRKPRGAACARACSVVQPNASQLTEIAEAD